MLPLPARGSGVQASPRARASALKHASRQWWGRSPASSTTWTVQRALATSASSRWRAWGQVDRGARPRLVQRHGRVAEATHVRLVAEGLGERLAEGDAGVLDGVVGVDLQVPLGLHPQVEAGVLAELGEHVVQERHAGVGAAGARAVQVELDGDGDLGGAALDAGAARPGHQASSSASAARNASSSDGVPTVTRRCRSSVG